MARLARRQDSSVLRREHHGASLAVACREAMSYDLVYRSSSGPRSCSLCCMPCSFSHRGPEMGVVVTAHGAGSGGLKSRSPTER